MSGFVMRYLRRQDKIGFAILALTAVLLAACSSPSAPAETPTLSSFADQLTATAGPADALQPAPASPDAHQSLPLSPQPLTPSTRFASLPSISTLVDQVEPAVVSISVEALNQGLFFDFTNQGAGTGMIIRPDGYILTNFHVIQATEQIRVSLPSGETYDARIIGADRITDLAVIKIDAEDLPTVRFGDSDSLKVGDWVVAMGNALALKGGPTVTLGIVSARGRSITTERGDLYDLIQTDAAINDGNSGGPLVNLDGEVIGISTAILRDAQGIGFAVSSSQALPIIDSLIENGRVVRPLIGLTGTDVTPANVNQLDLSVNEGIIVTRMSQDGPAYQAGIRVGDVITKLNDIPTPDMARFLTLLWTFDIEQEVLVEYIHQGRTRTATVQLTERPPGT